MCFSLGLSCKGFSVLLGLDDFLSNIGEIFNYNFFKNFLSAFLFSSSSGTTITWISMHLISSKLTQRLLRLSSVLFILFPLFCYSAVIYSILSSSSSIHSSASVISVISSFSVQFSHSVMSNSLQPHGLQQARLPCPSPTPGVYSNSCSLSHWGNPAISSSVVPFSSCP